jgi:outer membrane protein
MSEMQSIPPFARGAPVAVALIALFAAAGAVTAQGAPSADQADPIASAGFVPPDEIVVTLEQAVERALSNSPTMTQRTGAVLTASSAERSAYGSFLPSLALSSGASFSSTDRFDPNTATRVTGSSEAYSSGLSASMDVFTAGRRGAQLNQARAQIDAAEAALIEQRFAVALQAERSFYEVLRTDETIRLAEARLARAEQGLEAAALRQRVGGATRSDELRSRLEVNQARQALLAAQNARRVAAFNLGSLIGIDGAAGASLDGTRDPQPLSLSREQIIEIAVSRAPSVMAAEATVVSSEAAVRASRTQYFPTIRLGSGYDWSNQARTFDDGRTSWNLRLSMSYPIFNNFSREDAVARSQIQARTTRAQLDDTRRQARANVERVLGSLNLAEQQIVLATEAVEVAEEDLRVQQERYRAQIATVLEQITSQIALAEAEQALVAARFDYRIARAELAALIGRDL